MRCPKMPLMGVTDGRHAYLSPALITSGLSICSRALPAKLVMLESRAKPRGRERPQKQNERFSPLSKIVTYFWTGH